MTWAIRQITPEEAGCLVPLLAEVHAVHAEALPGRYQAEPSPDELLAMLRDWVGAEETTTIVAFGPDGAPLGCLIFRIETRLATPLHLADRWGNIELVGVDRAWRRAGIGLALVEEAKARLRARGIGRIRADHGAFNLASAGLMRKAGLEPMVVIVEGLVEEPGAGPGP